MSNGINIGIKDVAWNYAATFLQLGNGIILMPFILHYFPSETFTVWTIFSTIIALTVLLDLGFNQSFSRNISYIVSGAKELKTIGFHEVSEPNSDVDYHLFRGVVDAMKMFYKRLAALLFVLLITVGSFYIYRVTSNYNGNKTEVYVSWIILSLINSYSLYTFYYDALLQGKGLVKRAKQIQVTAQIVYLIISIALILLNFNLIAVVAAQAISVLVRRVYSYFVVYTKDFKTKIAVESKLSVKEILKSIYPNAVKLGFVNIGNAIVTRSAVIIGALYLSLEEMASYGITIQLIWVLGSVGTVYFSTYIPKLIQLRSIGNQKEIKRIYVISKFFLIAVFILGGFVLIFLGDPVLNLIKSKTQLLPLVFLVVMLFVQFFDNNRGMAEWVLSTKNEIPFFKASLFAGGLMLVLLIVFLKFTNLGIWSLVIAPAIAQNLYQNWKWPVVVIKELKIDMLDIRLFFNQARSVAKSVFNN